MQQYYITNKIFENEPVVFNKEQTHHIVKVMRMKNNDRVYVVDSESKKYIVEIEVGEPTLGHIVEKVTTSSEMGIRIYLAQGLIKGERWDYFLQKACEFGATDIIPLVLKRNVVKVNEGYDKKIERFNKIAQEAGEQSKRDVLPIVHKPLTLKELVKLDSDVKLVAYECDAGSTALKEQLSKEMKSIIFVAGSEGGFDESEVQFLKENGYEVVGLGPRILRAESASIYFLSALSYEKGLV